MYILRFPALTVTAETCQKIRIMLSHHQWLGIFIYSSGVPSSASAAVGENDAALLSFS